MARLQRPGPGPGRATRRAAARAGQVPRHLQPEPGRVLPGPRGRFEGPGRGRAQPDHSRRTTPAEQLLDVRDRSSALVGRVQRTVHRAGGARAGRRRHRVRTSTISTRTIASTSTRCSTSASSPSSRRWPSIPGHPFPYISDLSLNLAVQRARPGHRRAPLRRVKVPTLLPRFVVMPDGERFVPLEQVIAAHLDALFPGMEIEGPLHVPRHPQRRPHPRGRGGRRPARGGRDRAAPAPFRPRRAARDRRDDVDEVRELLAARARRRATTTSTSRRPARPRRAVGHPRRSIAPI